MELADYDWYLTLYEYWQQQGKSDGEIDKLFADMANGAKVVKGHTVMGELLSAGQFPSPRRTTPTSSSGPRTRVRR